MNNRYGRYSPQAWRTWHERRFHRLSCVVPPPMYSLSPVENVMNNRYGRHGTRAWKNWHERRFHRSCSDNDAYDVIVHLELPPVHTERIIFIMPNEDTHEPWENQEPIQLPGPDYSSQATGTVQKLSPHLKDMANIRAFDDIDNIKKELRRVKYVVLNKEKLEDWVKEWAKNDIKDNLNKDNVYDINYPELIDEYKNCYYRTFRKEICKFGDSVQEMKGDKEEQLRIILKGDRIHVKNCSLSASHIRNLVFARILHAYYPEGLQDVDIITMVSEQHAFIDRYAEYVRNEDGNEVIWPDPDSFQSR